MLIHLQKLLDHLIRHRARLGAGLVAALDDDETAELLSEIDVGRLDLTALDIAQPHRAGRGQLRSTGAAGREQRSIDFFELLWSVELRQQ